MKYLLFLPSVKKNKVRNDKLDRLYDQYQKAMYYSAYRKSKDPQLSQDAVQHSFEKLLEHPKYLDKLNENNYHSTKYYLCKMSVNAVKNMMNKNSNLSFDKKIFDNIEDDGISPLEFVLKVETKEHVKEELNKINKNYREIILMKFIRGLNYKEIAKALEISEENARKRYERAKKSLLKNYEKED